MARQAISNANASLYVGGSGNVTIASNASTLVIGDSDHRTYTWGGRFKIGPNTPTPTSTFFTKANTKYPFQFRVESGERIRIAVYDGSANPTVTSTKGVADNTWHTLVGVRDDNTISFYIDGLLVNTNTTTLGDMNEATNINYASNSFIGNASGAFFTFNAFTATDALNHHLYDTMPYECLFYHPLSEGAGSIAYDTSGNGNNGTITSGTWTRDTPTKTRKLVNNNLVYNGDFEIAPVVNVAQTGNYAWINGTSTGTNSTAEPIFGWFKYSYGGTQSAMIDTSELLNGKPSLKLSTTATNSYVGMAINSLDATYHKWNNIPCLPSTSYTASVWVKTSVASGTATTGVQVNITQMTGTGINSAGTKLNLVTSLVTSTGWTQYTGTFTTSATARFLVPELRIVGNDGTATLIADAWFADIQLYPTTPVTRNVATGRLTPTGRSAA